MSDFPISRPLDAATVPPEGLDVDILADEAERAALAATNDVVSVQFFEAKLHVKPFGRDGLSVAGQLAADATRTCVVTLEPFTEQVRERVDLRFAPEPHRYGASDDEDAAPDPLLNGEVDLGAVAAEFFTLALSPHPRKPDAVFEQPKDEGDDDSPFSALRNLGSGSNRPR